VSIRQSSLPGPELVWLLDLARQGGHFASELLGQAARQVKRGEEAVTEADRAVQRLIIAALHARFPCDGIIGEENEDGSAITNRAPTSGSQRVWVIDPIDGTNNYIAGFGACAVCIGLLDGGSPTLGVVHDFTRGESYAGQVGMGSWRIQDGIWHPTRVIADAPGPQSLLMLTSNLLVAGRMPRWAHRLLTMTPWKVRMVGSAALECVQVGAGIASGALTLNGKLWDVVAAAAVVLAAGGRITDFSGQDVFPIDLAGYSGGKVPFIATCPGMLPLLVTQLAHHDPVI
jgi:fructose-1,6-bisphosphatase/inositol monophosphatase family enzyme